MLGGLLDDKRGEPKESPAASERRKQFLQTTNSNAPPLSLATRSLSSQQNRRSTSLKPMRPQLPRSQWPPRSVASPNANFNLLLIKDAFARSICPPTSRQRTHTATLTSLSLLLVSSAGRNAVDAGHARVAQGPAMDLVAVVAEVAARRSVAQHPTARAARHRPLPPPPLRAAPPAHPPALVAVSPSHAFEPSLVTAPAHLPAPTPTIRLPARHLRLRLPRARRAAGRPPQTVHDRDAPQLTVSRCQASAPNLVAAPGPARVQTNLRPAMCLARLSLAARDP